MDRVPAGHPSTASAPDPGPATATRAHTGVPDADAVAASTTLWAQRLDRPAALAREA